MAELIKHNQIYRWVFLLAVGVIPVIGVNPFWVQILTSLGIYSILAISIDLLVGYTGQVSLGHSGFYAVGAYTSGILTAQLGLPFFVTLAGGILTGMIFGAILAFPAVRLKGFYLAMLTLSFAMIIENVLKNATPLTGGISGLTNIPAAVFQNLSLFGITLGPVLFYYLVWVLVLASAWATGNLVNSYWGRAFLAVEGAEVAAASLGIDVIRHKYAAFIISAGMAALAGVLYAHMVGYLSPEAFGFHTSALVLSMALVGGMQTTAGPIIGAAIFTLLPQYLYIFNEHQEMVYGLILLLSYTLMPKGLLGVFKKRQPLIKKVKQSFSNQALGMWAAREMHYGEQSRLKVKGLDKSFGGNMALCKVSLDINPGEIHALIGPNGSGKTTLINVISGVYKPDGGAVTFGENVISGLAPHKVAQLGIERTFQNLEIYPELTVLENVLLGAQTRFKTGLFANLLNLPSSREEEARQIRLAQVILTKLGLNEMQDHSTGGLPYGTQKMVELARAMMARPKVLLLDEPAAGLNAHEISHLESVLNDLKNEGITVLIIEHHLDFVLRLANRVTVLDFGSKIFEGSPALARRDPRVKEVYIGGDAVTA